MAWFERYRPQTIDELIGKRQKEAAKMLLESEEPYQRVLFIGPSGVGKTTVARMYANHINKGQYEYLNCRQVGVNDIREYLTNVKIANPLFTKYSVIILDEVDALSNAAQQQLLDIEDIPEWMVILATTKDDHKMREDLISRFLVFSFKVPRRAEIGQYLLRIFEEEDFEPDKESVGAIINNANGNLREILNAVEALSKGVNYVRDINEESNAFQQLFRIVLFNKYFDYEKALGLIDQQESLQGFLIAVCKTAIKSPSQRGQVVLEVLGEGLNPNLPEDVAFAHLLTKMQKRINE